MWKYIITFMTQFKVRAYDVRDATFNLQIAELSDLRDEILSRVSLAVGRATEHRNSFSNHAHLWTDDRQEFLTQFLVYGHIPTQVSYVRTS